MSVMLLHRSNQYQATRDVLLTWDAETLKWVPRIYIFVLSYCASLYSEFRVVMSVTISEIKMMFGSSLPPVVCRMTHVLFTLFVFACVWWCPTHIVLCICSVGVRVVYPMLQVSLGCPFFIVSSVFSNVY